VSRSGRDKCFFRFVFRVNGFSNLAFQLPAQKADILNPNA